MLFWYIYVEWSSQLQNWNYCNRNYCELFKTEQEMFWYRDPGVFQGLSLSIVSLHTLLHIMDSFQSVLHDLFIVVKYLLWYQALSDIIYPIYGPSIWECSAITQARPGTLWLLSQAAGVQGQPHLNNKMCILFREEVQLLPNKRGMGAGRARHKKHNRLSVFGQFMIAFMWHEFCGKFVLIFLVPFIYAFGGVYI